MKVILLKHTPEPEKTVTLAAKLCYSPSAIGELKKKVRGSSTEKFLARILKMGHLSVLEHASFTFGIEGVSRAMTHQLVRHRLASYSQQSQRYVDLRDFKEFIVPPSIKNNPKASKKFRDFAKTIHGFYSELVENGIPKEDARYILPNAAGTRIIVTMNARELLHFFTLRCCERAQWEIRDAATRMLSLAKKKAPFIFADAGPSCVSGPCSEGEMTCGKPRQIREKFKNL
ncbi:MAG TPA: FAD-dependent thymidylate synthase [Thermodesulfobacteriota bacterium]|nr:FAD-dependent thymidylate synthase [Thermodesulfobacteriota bacterium]